MELLKKLMFKVFFNDSIRKARNYILYCHSNKQKPQDLRTEKQTFKQTSIREGIRLKQQKES